MRLLFRLLFLIFPAFVLVSCKKDAPFSQKKPQTSLPNFGNVNPEKAVSDEESVMPGRSGAVVKITEYYDKIWQDGDLWGGLLVAKGNDILFEKYRGYAQPGNREPINENTPMHVASVSKTLTAMAALKLVEAGKLQMEDPLTKFFPGFPYPKVTVFTLLSQRSGLPKYEYFIEKINPKPAELSKTFLTNQDILNLLMRYKPDLARDTDTGFMYCNTNFALLALIIEKITKTPFPEAMQQMVFRPLEMEHTYIFQEKDTATAARSFYQRGPSVFPWDRLDLIFGDKNVYTTPRDLLKFSRAMFSKDFLKPELMAQVFEPHSNEKPGINNYGLGFRMKIFDNGGKLTYHNGWWHGSNAVFGHLLKPKATIIAIGNKYSNRVYTALALSSLFDDFPLEKEKLNITVMGTDSLSGGNDNSTE